MNGFVLPSKKAQSPFLLQLHLANFPQEISESARRVASTIDAHVVDEEEASSAIMMLEDIATTTVNWAAEFEVLRGDYRAGSLGHEVHSGVRIIQCLRTSRFLIGGAGKLRLSSQHHLMAALPKTLASDLIESLAHAPMPSQSALQRYELALDVSLMLRERQHNSVGSNACRRVARFGWADSSPQGGHNWLWIQSISVPVDALVRTWQAANIITDFAMFEVEELLGEYGEEEMHNLQLDFDMPPHVARPEYVEFLASISGNIREHIHPPVDLAPGFDALEHKVAACSWSFGLEVDGVRALRELCGSFYSFTTDLGTEKSMADFNALAEIMVPSWRDLSEFEQDVGDTTQEASDPAAPAAMGSHFLEAAITVVGLQHVTNNACKDMNQEVDLWDEFHAQLKNVEGLLSSRARRVAMVWTCVRYTSWAQYERLFDHWTATLYDKRWHEVTAFLSALRPLLGVLRHCWDERKFRDGRDTSGQPRKQSTVDDGGEDAGHRLQFDPVALTATLRDPMFTACVYFVLALNAIPEKLASWAEGCSCHEPFCRYLSESRQRAMFEAHYGEGWRTCPLRGKRAPELAAGVSERLAWANLTGDI